MKFKKCILRPNSNIREAISVIDRGGIGLAIVAQEDLTFIGTITDGDIRRALLRGNTLETRIDEVINKNATTALTTDNTETLKAMFTEKKISQIPIVDENRKIISIKTLRETLEEERKENRVFIMAGGKGVRLRPLTDSTPKPMLNVGGKPILKTIIENFKKRGFYRFTLCLNYLPEQIISYFEDGRRFGVEIDYIRENQQLGTAGALSLFEGDLDGPIIVTNGDIITNLDFSLLLSFHENSESPMTICLKEKLNQIPYGVVETQNNKVISIKEKPVQNYYINAGIYVINPEAIKTIPKDKFYDMTSFIEDLQKDGKEISTYSITDHWIDIGKHEEFDKAQNLYHEIFTDEI